jgi:hypothetical protein
MGLGKHRADTGTIPVPKIPKKREDVELLVQSLFEYVAAQEQNQVCSQRELDRLTGQVASRRSAA